MVYSLSIFFLYARFVLRLTAEHLFAKAESQTPQKPQTTRAQKKEKEKATGATKKKKKTIRNDDNMWHRPQLFSRPLEYISSLKSAFTQVGSFGEMIGVTNKKILKKRCHLYASINQPVNRSIGAPTYITIDRPDHFE